MVDAITEGLNVINDADKVGGNSERLTFKPFSRLFNITEPVTHKRDNDNKPRTRKKTSGLENSKVSRVVGSDL